MHLIWVSITVGLLKSFGECHLVERPAEAMNVYGLWRASLPMPQQPRSVQARHAHKRVLYVREKSSLVVYHYVTGMDVA